VTLLFLRQGTQVLGLGILAGAFGSTAIGKTLESVLFGVHFSDPSTIIVVSILFATAGVAAIWLPSRRAAHADPASVLREQ
jgi:ABC-type antimicrobial peptide transport system permease subunit